MRISYMTAPGTEPAERVVDVSRMDNGWGGGEGRCRKTYSIEREEISKHSKGRSPLVLMYCLPKCIYANWLWCLIKYSQLICRMKHYNTQIVLFESLMCIHEVNSSVSLCYSWLLWNKTMEWNLLFLKKLLFSLEVLTWKNNLRIAYGVSDPKAKK